MVQYGHPAYALAFVFSNLSVSRCHIYLLYADHMPRCAHANGAGPGRPERSHVGIHTVHGSDDLHYRLAGVGRRRQGEHKIASVVSSKLEPSFRWTRTVDRDFAASEELARPLLQG